MVINGENYDVNSWTKCSTRRFIHRLVAFRVCSVIYSLACCLFVVSPFEFVASFRSAHWLLPSPLILSRHVSLRHVVCLFIASCVSLSRCVSLRRVVCRFVKEKGIGNYEFAGISKMAGAQWEESKMAEVNAVKDILRDALTRIDQSLLSQMTWALQLARIMNNNNNSK